MIIAAKIILLIIGFVLTSFGGFLIGDGANDKLRAGNILTWCAFLIIGIGGFL